MVYHPIQKYKFESKSQRSNKSIKVQRWCITQYKNTNLKANHNPRPLVYCIEFGVSPNTKIQIWKQITTLMMVANISLMVYHPIQKYKFESKSQHTDVQRQIVKRCITQYKNTNLKANHNCQLLIINILTGVSPNTKIQIWKQITTAWLQIAMLKPVYHPIQKYKFESKSQPNKNADTAGKRCITQYKNTNLKANHNCVRRQITPPIGVSPNTKIQIWKQITTREVFSKSLNMVYHPIQKYKFESKSQQSSQR